MERFQEKGEHRKLRAFQAYGSRFLTDENGRLILNFASNDYLGLSELNKEVLVKSQPSSRLLAGNTQKHLDLEHLLSDYLNRPASLTYPSGYTANMGVLSCLPERGDLILMDRLSHASLLDGARLSGAKIERFHHQDMNHLESLLKRHQTSHRVIWVVSEGLFSMDGDLCPIQDLIELKSKYGALLLIDEAHSMGLYGKSGRGWADDQNCLGQVDILTFNLSKAFALQGGVVSGSQQLITSLIRHSRQQIYTTATPLSHLELLPERLESLKSADSQRKKLQSLCESLSKLLKRNGPWSPILPFHLDGAHQALDIAEELWKQKIYCPAILPPTVQPNTSRLRISLNATLSPEDLDTLSKSLGLT